MRKRNPRISLGFSIFQSTGGFRIGILQDKKEPGVLGDSCANSYTPYLSLGFSLYRQKLIDGF
jgi:hypothetical protein